VRTRNEEILASAVFRNLEMSHIQLRADLLSDIKDGYLPLC